MKLNSQFREYAPGRKIIIPNGNNVVGFVYARDTGNFLLIHKDGIYGPGEKTMNGREVFTGGNCYLTYKLRKNPNTIMYETVAENERPFEAMQRYIENKLQLKPDAYHSLGQQSTTRHIPINVRQDFDPHNTILDDIDCRMTFVTKKTTHYFLVICPEEQTPIMKQHFSNPRWLPLNEIFALNIVPANRDFLSEYGIEALQNLAAELSNGLYSGQPHPELILA